MYQKMVFNQIQKKEKETGHCGRRKINSFKLDQAHVPNTFCCVE